LFQKIPECKDRLKLPFLGGEMKRYILALAALLGAHGAFALGTGYIDAASAWSYSGWACDPPAPGYQVAVHAWRDDGKFLGGVGAVIQREAAVGAACGSPHSAHGFQLTIEQKPELMDGKFHNVTLYTLDHAGNPAPFPGGPVRVQFPGSSNNAAAPRTPGDVVGRELAQPGLGWTGHTGLWDGSRVIEMLNEGSGNRVFTNTWENFKSRDAVTWNTAYPNYPAHTVKSCWNATCDINSNRPDQQLVSSQQAVVRRAFQVYLIGADYTLTTYYTNAEPAMTDYTSSGWRRPPIRGQYRCDTFLYDAFRASTDILLSGVFPWRDIYNMPGSWRDKVSSLLSGVILPSNMLEKIRAF
jgi:hypothetical protein